jgi:hypothetical protein
MRHRFYAAQGVLLSSEAAGSVLSAGRPGRQNRPIYGMRPFWLLAAVLVGGGVLIGVYAQERFALGGWLTAGVLLIFAGLGKAAVRLDGHAS